MTKLQRRAQRKRDQIKHHPCGPSKLCRVMHCPGSVQREADEPDMPSEIAEEGTLLHQAICDRLIREPLWDDSLDEKQRELVQRCYEWYTEKFSGDLKPTRIRVEHWVPLRDPDGGEINDGTADLVIAVAEQGIHVVDWKFGWKPSPEALVLQIANYAIAVAQSEEMRPFRHLPLFGYAYFPWLPESQRLHTWISGMGADHAIDEYAPQIRAIVEAAQLEDAPLNAGPWCEYCRHLPNCETARETSWREIEPVTERSLIDPAKAVQLFELAAIAEKQAKAVRARIREQLLHAPDSLPGLRLKRRGGRRKVVSKDELKKRLVGKDGLSITQWINALDPAVPALEDAYVNARYEGRRKGRPTIKELKEAFAALAGDAVEKTENTVIERVTE